MVLVFVDGCLALPGKDFDLDMNGLPEFNMLEVDAKHHEVIIVDTDTGVMDAYALILCTNEYVNKLELEQTVKLTKPMPARQVFVNGMLQKKGGQSDYVWDKVKGEPDIVGLCPGDSVAVFDGKTEKCYVVKDATPPPYFELTLL
jgi:hypothetical protein